MACSASSHCLNQLYLIINGALGNNLQWALSKKTISIENICWKYSLQMTAILFRPQCGLIWHINSDCKTYWINPWRSTHMSWDGDRRPAYPKEMTAAALYTTLSLSTYSPYHYSDVIMAAMASQITSLAIVYSTVYSDADQRNIKAPRHWPLCREFTGDRWIPRTNGQLREKWFHLITQSWIWCQEVLLTQEHFATVPFTNMLR